MTRHSITRRDFLNGVAIGTGTGLLAPAELFARDASLAPPEYYPPTLTGMRGNHPGSFEVSHAMAWEGVKPAAYRQLDEHYDLVVVGAGMSGLAAARFYQQRMGTDAKVLLLDNHDDFGGHAKRNEFHLDGRMLLSIGGAVNLENPEAYSRIAKGLLDDLGVELEALKTNLGDFGPSGDSAEATMAIAGPDGYTKVNGEWTQLWLGIGDYETAVRALPISESDQELLIELINGDGDFLDDLSLGEKFEYVESVSYVEFLSERVGLSKESISIFFPFPILLYGPATPRLSVLEALYLGCPGIRGMGWLGDVAANLLEGAMAEYQALYFPDGNSSVARLLVHKLIPSVAPGTQGFDDIAVSHFDYSQLDRASHAVRVRLNSTVVGVNENSDGVVAVDYVCDGESLRVTGDHCILACYNAAIPYICPQLPESQKEALRYGVKVPLLWSNVLLRNGRAFSKLNANQVFCPNDQHTVILTAPPTTTGGNVPPSGPDDPLVLFMMGAPIIDSSGTETGRELCRLARHKIYATPFETYEKEIREQLQGVLGEHGFNHETDIAAITVNRWPHGYAWEYMSLDDPAWEPGKAPHELGRAQFGRISIANSDSEARAYLDAAIDAAWRAVTEQTA